MDTTYVLVTGANSGLGLGICKRLINEFYDTRPSSQRLHLVITTRSAKKAQGAIAELRKTVNSHRKLANLSDETRAELVIVQAESVELTDFLSIRACARRLLASSLPRIDVIILNAGILGIDGINFPRAIWNILRDWVHVLSFPNFYYRSWGFVTPPQFPNLTPDAPKALREAPPLAQVFTANVLGHYILVHELMPLLQQPESSSIDPGRIIWIGSQDADDVMSLNDIQGFRSPYAYENSKRAIDLLALSATVPACSPHVTKFMTPTTSRPNLQSTEGTISNIRAPRVLLCQPGLLGTNIVVLPFPLPQLWLAVLWVARALGSPWFTLMPYVAAIAPVFLALVSSEVLAKMESPSAADGGGIGKWGSASVGVFRSSESVRRSFVPSWGVGGHLRETPEWERFGYYHDGKDGHISKYSASAGRRRTTEMPTPESIAHFEEEGVEVWRYMEQLREEWMQRCELYEQWMAKKSQ